MSANFYELLKYAATGIASPGMTYYDRMRASTLMGGAGKTLTGIPPLSFKSNGKPLISWSMKGNSQQQGTPTPDNPVMPEFVGVRTGNLFPQDSLTGMATVVRDMFNEIGNSIVFNNGQYAISMNVTTESTAGIFKLCFTYTDDSQDKSPWISNRTHTITLVSNSAKVVKSISITNYNMYVDVAFSNIMLNAGTTALPYEPYGWAEKITCAGQTTPVYLGQTQTVRRIKKLVLTGEETIGYSGNNNAPYKITVSDIIQVSDPYAILFVCSHYRAVSNASPWASYPSCVTWSFSGGKNLQALNFRDQACADADAFKSYLAQQYAVGTPVTVWYVLATPETAIVNEPLYRIGDYCDELHSSDAGVSIPTVRGQNTLTVDTTLQPSEMTIVYQN